MKELSLIPLAKLNAALLSIGLQAEVSKGNAVLALTNAVNSGRINLEAIQAAVPVAGAASAVASGKPDARIDSLESAMLTLRSEVKLAMELTAKKVETEGHNIINQVSVFSAELKDALESSLEPIDYDKVNEIIRRQVAEIVEPFKRSATPEVLAEVADAIPVVRKAKAREVFAGVKTAYRSGGEDVDFGDMEVSLWGDAAAPAVVDDYVFHPRFLHESLLALERKLPMNCWLAGERGTGKTEFVTQLAARLQRKLYRINFDEAIERADFIGGNTIEGGDVVWKAGILSQAIQHAGAIVLFDEIGFARSQSIAVLHSVCEPSIHRGVTINETGKKISVLPYVGFFCADNSNGFGDSSGNFNGVRDQNTAFIDRFSYTFNFEYLPANKEAELISNRTDIHPKAAEIIVKFANLAREKSKSGLLNQPPSLRQLLAWAIAVKGGIPVKSAYQSAVVNKYPSDCSAELEGLFTAAVDVEKFKQLVRT